MADNPYESPQAASDANDACESTWWKVIPPLIITATAAAAVVQLVFIALNLSTAR